MHIVIIAEDNAVTIDGYAIQWELDLPSNIWALNWKDDSGEVEYNDGTNNKIIDNLSEFQHIIDEHALRKSRAEGESIHNMMN